MPIDTDALWDAFRDAHRHDETCDIMDDIPVLLKQVATDAMATAYEQAAQMLSGACDCPTCTCLNEMAERIRALKEKTP